MADKYEELTDEEAQLIQAHIDELEAFKQELTPRRAKEIYTRILDQRIDSAFHDSLSSSHPMVW